MHIYIFFFLRAFLWLRKSRELLHLVSSIEVIIPSEYVIINYTYKISKQLCNTYLCLTEHFENLKCYATLKIMRHQCYIESTCCLMWLSAEYENLFACILSTDCLFFTVMVWMVLVLLSLISFLEAWLVSDTIILLRVLLNHQTSLSVIRVQINST